MAEVTTFLRFELGLNDAERICVNLKDILIISALSHYDKRCVPILTRITSNN